MVDHTEIYTGDEILARRMKMEIRDSLFIKGLSNLEAAGKLNINSERVHKYTNPKCPNNNIPAYLIPLWHREIGPELLNWIASEAGAIVVDAPENPGDLGEALQVATKAMKECSEALQAYSKMIEEEQVTARGLKNLKREVQEALSSLVGLQVSAESMKDK